MWSKPLATLLFLLLFPFGQTKVMAAASVRTIEIRRLLTDMSDAKAGYDKNVQSQNSFRELVNDDLMLEGERNDIADNMAQDRGRANAFAANILNDGDSLRGYWEYLTGDEQSFVESTVDSLK